MLIRSRERESAVAGSDGQRSRKVCPIAGKRERARAGFRYRSRAVESICNAVVGGEIQFDGTGVRDRSRAERGVVVRVSRRAAVIGENKTERRRAYGFETALEAGKIAREFEFVRDVDCLSRTIDEEKPVAREFSGKCRRLSAASVINFYGVIAVAVFQNEILRKGFFLCDPRIDGVRERNRRIVCGEIVEVEIAVAPIAGNRPRRSRGFVCDGEIVVLAGVDD